MPPSDRNVTDLISGGHSNPLEEALKLAVERFRALAEATPQIVWTTDADGLVTEDSPAWRAFTGQTFDEWVGSGWLDALHPDDRAPTSAAWRQAVAERRPYEIVYRLRHVEGGYRETLARGVPVIDSEGAIQEWVGMNVDLTDRVRIEADLRRSESFNRSLMEGSADCVKVLDLSGRLESINLPGLKMLQIDDFESFRARDWSSLWPEETRGLVRSSVEASARGETVRFQAWCPTVKGSIKCWDVLVSPVRDAAGDFSRLLVVSRDVTEHEQATKELRDAEQQFRTLADSIPQLAWMARPDGETFWYNKRWYEYTGTTPEQMAGGGWESVHDPVELNRMLPHWEKALAAGKPWEDTFPLRRHDGEMRWHLSRAMPVRDESGAIVRWFGTNTDITDRRRTEEALARLKEESEQRRRVYEAALSNTPDLIYVFDLEHRFAYANEALLAMWGRTWEKSAGKTCLELGYPRWHAEMHDREIEQVVATKRPIRGEVPFLGTRGRRVYEYIFSPVLDADGKVVAVAGSTRDVTERQQSEQAIREQAEQLRETDRRKDEFLATLGHELRNPLASIVNAAEAMAGDRTSDADGGEMLDIVERQARHMSRLIDDLLDVARIARGKILLRAERLDFAEIVRETAEDHRREIEDAGLSLSVEIVNRPLWISGDRTRLAQIVGNLLHNAAKFTDATGRINASVAKERNQAVMRICDTGLGMSPEMLARIFVPFNQADASLARSRGGLGLGLALVKGLVELHGGTVTATSKGVGHGSEFLIRLPLNVLPESTAPSDRNDGGSATGLRILAIDDRRDILRPMQVLLTREGHEVEVMTDGRAGFEAAREFLPDVVICDIGLPGEMNGHDVARALRATPETSGLFLIALTGYGQETDRLAALAAGFDLHLTKPIDIRVLRSVLSGVTPRR